MWNCRLSRPFGAFLCAHAVDRLRISAGAACCASDKIANRVAKGRSFKRRNLSTIHPQQGRFVRADAPPNHATITIQDNGGWCTVRLPSMVRMLSEGRRFLMRWILSAGRTSLRSPRDACNGDTPTRPRERSHTTVGLLCYLRSADDPQLRATSMGRSTMPTR
jgi:hypothetical protein